MRTAFVSKSVVTPEGVRPAAILVEDGRILEVLAHPPAYTTGHDFGDLAIFPGLVDTHVHINDPGRADWEGFETATRAAIAGGYTTLVDMPLNSIPATTDVRGLREKRSAASGACHTDYAFWGGLVEGNQQDLEFLASAGVRGFKCFLVPSGADEFPMVTPETLRRAAPVIAKTGLPLLAHAELPAPIDLATRSLVSASCDWREYRNYLASRPDEAELAAIRLLIETCRESGCRIHIVHLSTAKALPELRSARAAGLPITVETCPHYLHFASEDVGDGQTVFKCAPPIRSRANREKLWEGLQAGDIDLVATDHSPCPPELKLPKQGDFLRAWGGIASLSIALPLMWSDALRHGSGLDNLARWMSSAPAQLAGLSGTKGQIAAGFDADLVVFDSQASFVVHPALLHYRHPLSAYMGETLTGVVRQTFLRGELAYHAGAFTAPRGRECARAAAALP
jgi:allantoinase